jgi:hypothetical protein
LNGSENLREVIAAAELFLDCQGHYGRIGGGGRSRAGDSEQGLCKQHSGCQWKRGAYLRHIISGYGNFIKHSGLGTMAESQR